MKGRKPKLKQARILKQLDLSPFSWMSAEAKKEWKRLLPIFAERYSGVVTDLDLMGFAALCQAWGDYVGIIKSKKGKKAIIPGGERGISRKNPLLGAKNEIARELLVWLGEFGLTPVSRARIANNQARPSDALDEFIASKPKPKLRVAKA